MEIIDFQPKATPNIRAEWKPTIIVPVGDTQYGSESCSAGRFKQWMKRVINMAEERECQLFFLGMGDYTDSLRPSIRRKFLNSGLDEDEHFTTYLNKMVQNHMDGFSKLVEGTEDKWLGMLEGHHFFDFGNGTTSDTIIADRLGATFLGDCARIHLTFERPKPKGKISSVDFQIWCHHGEGGGQAGSAIRKLIPVKGAFEADAFLMAHQHKTETAKVAWCYDKRVKNGYRMMHKDISLTCTGGWLQGYMQGSRFGNRPGGHYPEQKLLIPLSIGGVRLELLPIHEEHRDWVFHEVVV